MAGASDGWDACFRQMLVMRREEGILKPRADDEGYRRKRLLCHWIMTGMPAVCRRWLCVGKERCCCVAALGFNVLDGSDSPDQCYVKGPLYRHWLSWRRFLEVRG